MSTVLSAPVPSRNTMPNRAKTPPLPKHHPHAYTPWRETMSERQVNAYFERQILPKLSVLLDGSFQALTEFDREEAVQDAICQALEAFRTLKLYENIHQNTASDERTLALAKFASSQYLAGVRFANPRSESRP